MSQNHPHDGGSRRKRTAQDGRRRRTRSDRGQAVVVGAVLVFGIIVISLSLFQAFAVPDQNARVEFNHYQEVQQGMQQLRGDLLKAGRDGTATATTIPLGTTYPARFILINPPPATGTVRTTGAERITATGFDLPSTCGVGTTVTTRRIVYQPSYNQLSPPDIVYENSLVYRTASDGETVFDSGQALLRGSTIHLYPVQGDVAKNGVEARTVDIYGNLTGVATVENRNVTLTVPSGLPASAWEAALSDERRFLRATQNGSSVDLELARGDYTVRCSPVGLNSIPNTNPETVAGEDGSTGIVDGGINPDTEGSVTLVDVSTAPGSNNVVRMKFVNNGDGRREFTAARIAFYDSKRPQNPSRPNQTNRLDNADVNDVESDELVLGGPFEQIDGQSISVDGGESVTVDLHFEDENDNKRAPSSDDFFILQVTYDDDVKITYFVSVP